MNGSPYLMIGCTALLMACGQDSALTDQGIPDQRMSELEARVAARTGQTVPADRPMAEGSWEQQPEMAGAATGQGMPQQPGASGAMRTHTIHSSQFKVPMAQIQLPAHWNVQGMQTGNWSARGPGLTVKNTQAVTFMHPTGQLGQFYQANNMRMRAPVAPEQVVMQDLAPRMRQEGYELVGQAAAPGVEQVDQRGLDGLYISGQQQRTCKANVSEWRRGDSRRAVVLHWFSIAAQGLVSWGYYTTELEAPQGSFERERNNLLSSLAGMRHDQAYFATYARHEQQKEQQSWAAHNQRMQSNQQSWDAHNARMRSNQAAFDARQAAHRDMVNGVNNSIMGTWNSNNASMDRQQNATINGIRGEQDAWNPHNGQQGKVEAGYNNYWVNSDGQYIGTNDVMYDPNSNGQWVDQWQQMPTQP